MILNPMKTCSIPLASASAGCIRATLGSLTKCIMHNEIIRKQALKCADELFNPSRLSSATSVIENHMATLIEQQQKDIVDLKTKLAYAEDAATKGELARQTAGGMEMEIEELRRTILLMKPYVKGEHSWSCRNSTRELCTCGWEEVNTAIDAAMQETKITT